MEKDEMNSTVVVRSGTNSFITKIDINKFTFFLLFSCLFNKMTQTNDTNSTILIRKVY